MLLFERKEEVVPYQGLSRVGFTFTYIPPLGSYALFGGINADSDVHLFSITKGTWTHVPTFGPKKPPSRKYHAAAFIQSISCLLVNGGEDDKCHTLQDFFVLSIKDWKWSKLIVVKYPEPRTRHSIFARSKSELILFGGVQQFDKSNDIWLLKAHMEREGKQGVVNLDCIKVEPRSRVPEGRICAEGTVYVGDKLYAACLRANNDFLRIFCFDFRQSEWREIDLSLRFTQARMFRTVDSEGFVLAIDAERRKNQPSKFYFFDSSEGFFQPLRDQAELFNNCDEVSGEGGDGQILCLRQGKRIFTARYAVLPSQQPESSIEDYLIAIKHEQILSQELARKNSQLEELYREMQNYITQLNKHYMQLEGEPAIDAEKQRHIEDCHNLKHDYSRLDRLYDQASQQVRGIRADLTAINEDFERCMETEFDDEQS